MYIVCRHKPNLYNFMLGNKELTCDFGLRSVKNDNLNNFLIIRKPAFRRLLFPRKKKRGKRRGGEGGEQEKNMSSLSFEQAALKFCLQGGHFLLVLVNVNDFIRG